MQAGPWLAAAIGAAAAGGAEGVPPAAVPMPPGSNAMARAAEYSASRGGRAFLVQVDGRVVFERYDGWPPNLPHPLASGTKSFTGVLAMLAVQDGLLQLDERAADTLTEWAGDPGKSKITVRQLLQLSSGLPAGDRQVKGGGRSGARLLGWAASNRTARLGLDDAPEVADGVRAALELPLAHEPGTKFDYGPSHFYAFVGLLRRKLESSDRPEKNVIVYLHRRLLETIGIPNGRVGRDRAGHPDLAGGMLLTAREWARFGQFIADRGARRREDGTLEPWLKPELLAECFRPSPANPRYGLTWWLPSGAGAQGENPADGLGEGRRRFARMSPVRDAAGRPVTAYMAAGLGTQRLLVLSDQGWVIVRFADGSQRTISYSDAELVRLLFDAPSAPSANGGS